MQTTTILRTHRDAAQLAEALLNAKLNGPHEVTIKPKNKRSPAQNSTGHVWYVQISRTLHEDTPEGVKCECKLRFGVPILRADDEHFREQYDRLIKDRYSYEEKLELMRWFPVTSLMNKAQKSEYLEQVRNEFGPRGVQLEFGEEAA